MKLFSFMIAATFCLTAHIAHGEESKTQPKKTGDQKKEIVKISEAFGHLIGKNLESIGLEFDIQAVVKGLKDAAAGKNSPMTETECIQAISVAQEAAFLETAQKNLVQADEFLKKNSAEKGIISCEEGKVQYKIEKEGTGELLKASDSPLIHYVGKFLDGAVFGDSKEPEPFSLEEVISGLKVGLLGMKEGEKRTIFIHPDYAYGTKGSLPPNSLLTFEIELLKTQAPFIPMDSPAASQMTSEIAIPRINPSKMSDKARFTIVLFQPQIPQNAGNIVRTCKVTGADLVLVKPLGFSTSNASLKRAGLDYWDGVSVKIIDDLPLWLAETKSPFYFFSSHAKACYSDVSYPPNSIFIFGSETSGLPSSFHQNWSESFLTLPMVENSRCLNLANTVSIVLYEAWRQIGFLGT